MVQEQQQRYLQYKINKEYKQKFQRFAPCLLQSCFNVNVKDLEWRLYMYKDIQDM